MPHDLTLFLNWWVLWALAWKFFLQTIFDQSANSLSELPSLWRFNPRFLAFYFQSEVEVFFSSSTSKACLWDYVQVHFPTRFENASLQRPCYVSSLSECVLKAKLELGSMKSLTAAKCWVIEVQAWTVCEWQKLSSHILASSKRLCKRSLPSFSHGQIYGSIDRMVADCSTGSVVQRFRSRSVGRKSTRFVPIYC